MMLTKTDNAETYRPTNFRRHLKQQTKPPVI